MRIISIANQKGGCGKTTTAVNLSSSLAQMGHRVLLIDADPQGHASVCLKAEKEPHPTLTPPSPYPLPEGEGKSEWMNASPRGRGEKDHADSGLTLFDVLASYAGAQIIPLGDAMQHVLGSLTLVPSSTQLISIEQQDILLPQKEFILRHALQTLKEPFDFVLFDCPPSLGILTTGALLASSEVIVSVETSFLSLHGVGLFLNSIGTLKERFSHPLKVRALATMYDRRTILAKEVLRDISGYFKDQLFDTVIHHNVKLREASSHGIPVNRYDPSSLGSKDYLAMAQELISRTN